MGQISNYILIGIGGIIGFLAKSTWDYVKLRIIHRAEIEKISINIYFEFAKKYYLKMLHLIDNFAGAVCQMHKGKTDEETIIRAFYFYLLYLKESFNFCSDCGVWFLTAQENEDRMATLQEEMNDVVLPFNFFQRSYLESALPRDHLLTIQELCELIENDKKIKENYSSFKESTKCNCKSNSCNLLKLHKLLAEFSSTLVGDLNSAFKDWYDLRRSALKWDRLLSRESGN